MNALILKKERIVMIDGIAPSSERGGLDPNNRKRRRRRPSPTGEQVLERAFELFANLGYDGTTIDTITESIGVTKRTLYDKYGDKDALFQAALQHTIGEWIIPAATLRALECDDLEETLVGIAFKLLENLLSAKGLQLLQLTGALSARMPQLGAHNVQHGTKPTIAYLADLFQRRIGEKPGAFSTAEGAGMAFLNLTVGGLANFVASGVLLDEKFIDNYVKSSVNLFLMGIVSHIDPKAHQAVLDENVKLKIMLADLFIKERSAIALD